ncbi:MAG: ABC transporter permease [Clostridiales bacterium]|nr:ABC transporter permease [Clostridiales bacterium]
MKLRTYKNFFRESIRNIFRNRVMSFASVVAIMSALFILGLVLILAFNLEHIAGGLESKVEITAFLHTSVGSAQSRAVIDQVEKLDGVHEVEFISKEQGLAEWKENLGEKGVLLEGYEGKTNPLPDKLILRIEKPEYVGSIIPSINAIPEVDKVNYSREVVDTIGKVVRIARLVGLLLMLSLMIVAMVIINNTIKINVYSRRREITIMKYIGATDSYIRWPYIIEGFTLGIIAAFFAGVLVIGGYNLLLSRGGQLGGSYGFLSLFQLLPIEGLIYDIVLAFLLVGCGVGVIASILSTGKHLKA